jgi:hypothetical protein
MQNRHLQQYIGISSESKPVLSVKVGTEFYETDTGNTYVFGTDGAWIVLSKSVSGKPRVSSMPYLYDIAEGNVTGHSGWSKIGFNPDVGTAEEDIWLVGGQYVAPTSNMQMEVYSDNAGDAAAGGGARSLWISYLTTAGATRSTTIVPTGTVVALTAATDIGFVNAFRIITCGTGQGATGTISLRNLADTPIYSQIAPKYSRARNINYMVPANKNLFVTSLSVSVYGATKGIRFTTRANWDPDAGVFSDFYKPFTEINMANGAFLRNFEVPTKLPGMTRLKVSGIADAAGAVCAVALRGWLEDV